MPGLRQYETLYIVAPELSEEDQKKVIDGLNDHITKSGGEIIKSEPWGKRKLAYPINRRNEGFYVLVRISSSAQVPKDVETYIARTPAILRHLTTVVSKQQLKEESRLEALKAKRAEEAQKAAEEAAKREAEAAAAAAESASAEGEVVEATEAVEETQEASA